MKKTLADLTVAAGLFAAGIVALASPASATATPGLSWGTCSNLTGWYVNPDEGDRKPTATEAGLKFEGDDLIHHAITNLSTDTLTSGSFNASPAPDQDSFLSVEVADVDGSGYATLRWNTSTNKWNMVTGGQFYENANATSLVNSKGKSKRVISFGVGYTKNPPGTVATVVKSVMFDGKVYPLTCPQPTFPSKPVGVEVPPGRPDQTPGATPSTTTPPATATPEPSSSSDADVIIAAAGGTSLPVTGPGVKTFALLGVMFVGVGAGLLFVLRRRKVTFSG